MHPLGLGRVYFRGFMKFAVAVLLSCWLFMSVQIPTNKGYINDLTNTITEQEALFLDQQLRIFEAMEGVQIIVLVLPSLEGQSIEIASQQVASQWQIGPSGRDSGILMLVAKNEALSYIDLGYGMDTNINDEMAQKISTDIMNPLLKRGRIYRAVEGGIGQIFAHFGKTIGASGPVNVGSFLDMTSLIIFLAAIPLLYFTARSAASKHIWISPTLGFLTGLTQSLGLAVALGCMGGLMVLICFLIKSYLPPKQ